MREIQNKAASDCTQMRCLQEARPQRQEGGQWWPGAGEAEQGVTAEGHTVSSWADENFLQFDSADGGTTL